MCNKALSKFILRTNANIASHHTIQISRIQLKVMECTQRLGLVCDNYIYVNFAINQYLCKNFPAQLLNIQCNKYPTFKKFPKPIQADFFIVSLVGHNKRQPKAKFHFHYSLAANC